MSEHQQQCATVTWFRYQYPQYAGYLFAIPNGGVLCDTPKTKRKLRMAYMFAEGFKSGVSDLFLAVPRGIYHGLWLEMKDTGKGVEALTEAQLAHIKAMQAVGYAATFAAGFGHAQAVIKKYMNLEAN